MSTHTESPATTRFALRPDSDRRSPVGAWWPTSRSLTDRLDDLFALWPPERGHIQRVLYSPPDWDDRPHAVVTTGRRVKTGSFPRDDTHVLTLMMSSGRDQLITVIPPSAPEREARRLLNQMSGRSAVPDDHDGWDDDGGHP